MQWGPTVGAQSANVFEDLRRRKNPCCLVVSGYNYGGTGVGTRAEGGGEAENI